VKKWFGEPLVHFLVIGAALFLFYGFKNDGYVDYDNRIVITEADIKRLGLLWEKKWQRPPLQFELEGLIEQQIREEVLYREALSMGLDQNDTVVRRRMAQKVEFISSDLAGQLEPSEEELTAYLTNNPEKFEIPGRISFTQIYLNTDRHGENIKQDALDLLGQLKQEGPGVDISEAGDPFMFGAQHDQLSHHGVSRLFGDDFATRLFELPVGSWQGPVWSGYGLHLVLIEDKTESTQPELSDVLDDVRNEWLTEQRRTLDEALYKSLRKRYEIQIDGMSG
jgi:hypothetical protein